MKPPIEISTPIIKIRGLNLAAIPVLAITSRFSTPAFVDDAVEGISCPPIRWRTPYRWTVLKQTSMLREGRKLRTEGHWKAEAHEISSVWDRWCPPRLILPLASCAQRLRSTRHHSVCTLVTFGALSLSGPLFFLLRCHSVAMKQRVLLSRKKLKHLGIWKVTFPGYPRWIGLSSVSIHIRSLSTSLVSQPTVLSWICIPKFILSSQGHHRRP